MTRFPSPWISKTRSENCRRLRTKDRPSAGSCAAGLGNVALLEFISRSPSLSAAALRSSAALRREPPDSGVAELLDDCVVEVTSNRQALLDLRHDAPQFEFQRRFSEGHQISGRRRRLNDLRVSVGDGGQDVADLVRVAVVADPDLDHDPA